MDKTIQVESHIGQRLSLFRKTEKFVLMWEGRKLPLVRKITIGRDRVNDIVLDDVLVSRQHAMIQKIRNVYFIRDMDSTNGTFINGEQVPPSKYCRLERSDRIRIGKIDLTLL